jgi:hypothetical protein
MDLNRIDLLVTLKLAVLGSDQWTQTSLARDLGLAQSQVNTSLKRAGVARLFNVVTKQVRRQALAEFLVHGVKYAFPAVRGGETRGIPTSYAALPLSEFISNSRSMPPVWPHPSGSVRGCEFEPLDKRAPKAALSDPNLYALLALVDAIRDGTARETSHAVKLLRKQLGVAP